MIPRLKADLRIRDLLCLLPSFDSNRCIEEFEGAFAEIANAKHAFAFPHGRTAQIAILEALSGDADEVICPSYTCVSVPHAIVKAGFEPVFVDSNVDDFNMDWKLVEGAVTPNTRAIIATSIFGHPVNGQSFRKFVERYPDIPIIQDCAHGFFANDSHQDGLCAFYGLNISKIITSIFGGMVTTNDDEFALRLGRVRNDMLVEKNLIEQILRAAYLIAVIVAFSKPVYSFVNRLERMKLLDRFVKYYDPTKIYLPSDAFKAMCGIEARVGKEQTKRYSEIVSHRQIIANIYSEKLEGARGIILPPYHQNMTVSHYAIRTNFASSLKEHCLNHGVQLGELIEYDCAEMPVYNGAKYHGEKISQQFPKNIVNLPVHVGVTEKKAIEIAMLIQNFLEMSHK